MASADSQADVCDHSLVDLQLTTKISNGPKNHQESDGSLNQNLPINTQEEVEAPYNRRDAGSRYKNESTYKSQSSIKASASKGAVSVRNGTSKKQAAAAQKYK